MAETTPPDDLVRLKSQYLQADAEYRLVCQTFPTGQQIVALIHDGLSPATNEQTQQAHDAYERCVNLGRLIQCHPWWRAQPSRADAVRALTAAAQQQIGAKLDAPIG
jgi:hypothetical protein